MSVFLRFDPRVYVASRSDGCHKVGMTTSIKGRLSNLRAKYGPDVEIVDSFTVRLDDMPKVERYAHWLLLSQREKGEWFRVQASTALDAVRSAIAAVAEGLQAPTPKISGDGRPSLGMIITTLRAKKSTYARIDVLVGSRQRARFMRDAIEEVLARREAEVFAKAKPD